MPPSPAAPAEGGGRPPCPPNPPPPQPRGPPRSLPPPRPDPALGLRAAHRARVTSHRAPPGPHSHAVTSPSTTSPPSPRGACGEVRGKSRETAKQSKPNPRIPSPPHPKTAPPALGSAPGSRGESDSPVPPCVKTLKATSQNTYAYVRTCGSTRVLGNFLTGGAQFCRSNSGPRHRLH